MRVKYYGLFDAQGKLQASAFVAALNAFRSRRVPVVLTVEEDKGKRTLPQNDYYWKVIEWVGYGLRDLGWEPKKCGKEAVHEMMKSEFLTVDEPLKDGVFIKRPRSTTELNKEEFSEYLEHVIRFAAEEVGVVIPPPNTQMEIAA